MRNRLISGLVIVVIITAVFIYDLRHTQKFVNASPNYSVYVNNEFYGLVKDISEFESYVNTEYNRLSKENAYGSVYMPENYQLEVTSSNRDTKLSDDEVFDKFKDNVKFLTDGYKLTVYYEDDTLQEVNDSYTVNSFDANVLPQDDGAPTETVYTTSEEMAKGTMDSIITTFIDEDEKNNIQSGDVPLEFNVGTNVTIAYDVNGTIVGSNEKVPIDSIKSGDELYNEMLFNNVVKKDTYVVKAGDTVQSIAADNSLNELELIAANKSITEENTILTPGQELVVNLVDPIINIKSTKILVKENDIPYSVEVEKDPSRFTDAPDEIKQKGTNGKKVTTYRIDYLNGQSTASSEVIEENIVSNPTKQVVVRGTKVRQVYGSSSTGGSLTKSSGVYTGQLVSWGPATAAGGYLSSPFAPRWGTHHDGIDIAGVPLNSGALAVSSGVVIFTGWERSGSGGNMVAVDHQNGFVTWYLHLNSIDVHAGDVVAQGQRVGGVGRTGFATGIHLHLQMYRNGVLVNPESIYSGFY